MIFLEMYPYLNDKIANVSGNMSSSLTYIFTYTDAITGGLSTTFICLALFMVAFIGSLIAQQRFTTNMRIETSLLAASFVTLGFEIILVQQNLVDAWLLLSTIFITILSFIWVTFGTSETG